MYERLRRPQRLRTTCLDTDPRAIAYAKALNQPYLSHIQLVQKNALRFHSKQTFHLIWSAGLFNYFNDKVFVALLGRFRRLLEPGGEVVIGNFNQDHNPSRAYMEIFGGWYLHHRSKQQLLTLAQNAGFDDGQITVSCEAENINLFLHIKADG